MNAPLYTCSGCGAHLALAQLRGTDCPYCKAVFPHHARAVEQAAVVQQVMAQNLAAVAPPPVLYVGAPGVYPYSVPLPGHVAAQVGRAMEHTQKAILWAVGLSVGLTVLGVVVSFVASL